MRTVGVDLAAGEKRTALAAIDWSPGRAEASVVVGVDDGRVVEEIGASDKAGIDCPLGWPERFVDFLNAHREGSVGVPTDDRGRAVLRYRETDRAVIEAGVVPLSVSSDRIGVTAMRAAGILSRLERETGEAVARAGDGKVVEVYPAVALRRWDLIRGPYKGRARVTNLSALAGFLLKRLPTLRLGDDLDLFRTNEDAFDAVICALIARAARLGDVTAPSGGEQLRLARREGWIAVPTGDLADLSK